MQQSFGFVSLGISPVYPEDTGTYTCVAMNRVGSDQTQAQLLCQAKEALMLQTLHQGAMAPIQQLDSHQVHIGPMLEDRPEEIYSVQQPQFVQRLPATLNARQEQRVRLECRVQPANDPKLIVEWYV